MTALEFRCRCCAETHVGLPAWHFDAPAQASAVPTAECDRRINLTADRCVIDGEWFFAKGLLEVRVLGMDEPFTWGVWLSLSRKSFDRYVETFDDRLREEGEEFFGWLCNDLPGYPPTLLLKAQLRIRRYPQRPSVELEPTEHPLAVDQRDGITAASAVEMAERLLHPDAIRDRQL